MNYPRGLLDFPFPAVKPAERDPGSDPEPSRLVPFPIIQRLEIRQDDREEFEAAVATIRALAAKDAPGWEFVKTAPVSIAGAELVVKS